MMQSKNSTLSGFVRSALAIGALATASCGASAKETVLHAFAGGAGDGASPNGVIMDSAGVIYGTTQGAGANNGGTVFSLTPNNAGGYDEKVLYNFCPLAGCADGQIPYGKLIIDTSGNFYGVTIQGGKYGKGTAFELTKKGKLITLYNFCRKAIGSFAWMATDPVTV